jgi:hypothetical protein
MYICGCRGGTSSPGVYLMKVISRRKVPNNEPTRGRISAGRRRRRPEPVWEARLPGYWRTGEAIGIIGLMELP